MTKEGARAKLFHLCAEYAEVGGSNRLDWEITEIAKQYGIEVCIIEDRIYLADDHFTIVKK